MPEASSHDSRRREQVDTGLYRRITKSGHVRYDVVTWQSGRQQVRALPPGTTEPQARKAALQARALAADGKAPVASALRLRDVVDEYLVHAEARTLIAGKGRMSETTLDTYR